MTPAVPLSTRGKQKSHSRTVRIAHWINACAMIVMISSGWRIHDAHPIAPFQFPDSISLGGWLGGALLWHFAAMWVLTVNFLVYVAHGLASGHFRRALLPITPGAVVHDLKLALQGRLAHQTGGYNAVQRLAYVGVLSAILLTILSGLAIWKPVQLQELTWAMGGFQGARVVHFLGMSAIVAFLVVHLTLVVLVPRTLLPMLTGQATDGQRSPAIAIESLVTHNRGEKP